MLILADGYGGLSCQNAVRKSCRKRLPGFLNNPDELALVGVSEKCSCNGHSEDCDQETCKCQDCQHDTIGDFCEKCKVTILLFKSTYKPCFSLATTVMPQLETLMHAANAPVQTLTSLSVPHVFLHQTNVATFATLVEPVSLNELCI